MSESDPYAPIEASAQHIVGGYPLAAGLSNITDIVGHLRLPTAAPPSFELERMNDLLSIEDDLLAQYANEMNAILDSPDARSNSYAQHERQRAGEFMRALRLPQTSTPRAPFPISNEYVDPAQLSILGAPPAATASFSSADSPAFLAAFVHSLAPPPSSSPVPTPIPSSVRGSSPPLAMSSPVASGSATPAGERVAYASPIPQRVLLSAPPLLPPSSPDPLLLGDDQPQFYSQPTRMNVTLGGHRFTHSNVPPSRLGPPSSQQTIKPTQRAPPPPSSSPLTPHSSRHSTFAVEVSVSSHKRKGKGTDSQHRRHVDSDETVKRFKLASADSTAGGASSTRGTIRGGDNVDHVERLSDLITDVLLEEDAAVEDTSTAALGRTFDRDVDVGPVKKSLFRSNGNGPDETKSLRPETLRKLEKQLEIVRTKRKGDELVEDVESDALLRLMRVLARSWDGVDEVEFWPKEMAKAKVVDEFGDAATQKKPKQKAKSNPKSTKQSTPSRRKKQQDSDESEDEFLPGGEDANRSPSRSPSATRSRSPQVPSSPLARQSQDAPMKDGDDDDELWSEEALETFAAAVRTMTDAVLAVNAALSVLSLTKLEKHFYSVDTILGMLSTLRRCTEDLLFPLLEALPGSALAQLASAYPEALAGVFPPVESAMPKLIRLLRTESMSDEIVISCIYFSLGPFFHDAPAPGARVKKADKEGGPVAVAIKAIRAQSLGLVTTLYSIHPDQRSSILEELLGSATKLEIGKKGKGAVKLRNGHAIHTVSALLLHLLQTCPANLRDEVSKAFREAAAEKKEDVHEDPDADPLGMDIDQTEQDEPNFLTRANRDWFEPALDSAHKSARMVIGYLISRACKGGKTSSSSAESEYRVVFEVLVADCLSALRLPEWPAAELLLQVCALSMMSSLADPKSTHDTNALKGLALDHVGQIGATIRRDIAPPTQPKKLLSLNEIVETADLTALEALFSAQLQVISHLSLAERSVGSWEGAAEFVTVRFARELSQAAAQVADDLASGENVKAEHETLHERLATLSTRLWDPIEDDIFGPSLEDEKGSIDQLALELLRLQPLASTSEPLLERILDGCELQSVSFRGKALRALGLVIAEDPSLFVLGPVKRRIQAKMRDSSPAVRDIAIELIGKYVINRPELAEQYLPLICERAADAGLGVRKRVVKLVKALYAVVGPESARVEIGRCLIWRVKDEDEGVRELAVEAVDELWFAARGPSKTGEGSARLAATVLGLIGGAKGQAPAPVDDLLRSIMARHVEKGTPPPRAQLRELTESLLAVLVEDEASTRVVDCVKAIHVLHAAEPDLLGTAQATLLLPYLKSARTAEEQATCDLLLRIFRTAVEARPNIGPQFGRDLEKTLLMMINRPPKGMNSLQEIVSCFCAVVWHQTHDFEEMIRTFKVSLTRLVHEITALEANPAKPKLQLLSMVSYISALLCESGRFDSLRIEQRQLKPSLDEITNKSISEHVHSTLIRLHELNLSDLTQQMVLSCLGFLWRAYPRLIQQSATTAILDSVFASNEPRNQLHLLKILQDFLASQAERSADKKVAPKKARMAKGVRIDELVGTTDGFADVSVAGAIAQRYLDKILKLAVSPSPPIQRVAADILVTVARSGFTHPISIWPVLIALTASPDSTLADRVYATAAVLHSKHASMLATRFHEPVKAMHSYLQTTAPQGEIVDGFVKDSNDQPTSRLARWYGLLQKEKRQMQLEYLRILTRFFEIDTEAACTEDDLALVRFVAEALATLDFKRNEEPMLVISKLNAALAVSGLQVLHLIENLARDGDDESADEMALDQPKRANEPSADLARQSAIFGVALLLRDHLKNLYAITDAKLAKYVPMKKSAQGDRATSRRAEAPLALNWDSAYEARLPFARQPMGAVEDWKKQVMDYATMVAEDGTLHGMNELEQGEADDDDDF